MDEGLVQEINEILFSSHPDPKKAEELFFESLSKSSLNDQDLLQTITPIVKQFLSAYREEQLWSFLREVINRVDSPNQQQKMLTVMVVVLQLLDVEGIDSQSPKAQTHMGVKIWETLYPKVISSSFVDEQNIQLVLAILSTFHRRYFQLLRNDKAFLNFQVIAKVYVNVGKSLGKGSFAEVYLGYHSQTGMPVAIKRMDVTELKKKIGSAAVLNKTLDNEVKIMKSLNHPNIVRLLDMTLTDKDIMYLVIEYCEGGTLGEYIDKRDLSAAEIQHIMCEIAAGLRALQSKNIIHRDLKPANMLLKSRTEWPTIKLADFAFAKILQNEELTQTFCGTPLYRAPEVGNSGPYAQKCDLWSVGCIMFELVYGVDALRNFYATQVVNKVGYWKINFPPTNKLSPEGMKLLEELLKPDPSERCSFAEFFSHPYVRKASITNSSITSITSITSDQISQLRTELAQIKTQAMKEKMDLENQVAKLKLEKVELEKKLERGSEQERQIMELANKISILVEEIAEKEKISQKLAEDLEKSIQTIKGLQAQLEDQRKTSQSLEQKQKEYEKNLEQSTHVQRENERNQEKSNQTIQSLQVQLDEQRKIIESFGQEKKEHETLLEKSNQTIKGLQTQLEDFRKTSQSKQKEHENLLEKSNLTIQDLQRQVQDQKKVSESFMEHEHQMEEAHQKQVAELNGKLKERDLEVQNLKHTFDELRRKLNEKEKEVALEKEKNMEVSSVGIGQVEEMKQKVKQLMDTNDYLQRLLESTIQEKSLTEQVRKKESEDFTNELKQLRKQLESSKQKSGQFDEYPKQLAQLNSQLEELRAKLRAKELEVDLMHQSLNAVQSKTRETDIEYEQQTKALGERVKEKDEVIRKKDEEIQRLQKRIVSVETAVADKEMEIKSLTNQIIQMVSNQEALNMQIEELKLQQKQKPEVDSLKARVEEEKKKQMNQLKEIQTLRTQLQGKEMELKMMQDQLVMVTNEFQEKEKQLNAEKERQRKMVTDLLDNIESERKKADSERKGLQDYFTDLDNKAFKLEKALRECESEKQILQDQLNQLLKNSM